MDTTIAVTKCLHCGSLTQGEAYCCSACQNLHQRFESHFEMDPELLFLDQPNFRGLYLHSNSEYQYQLYVEGLHCSSCVHLLEKMPEFDESVLEARVDYARSRLALKTRQDFSLAHAATLLKSWGYAPHFLKSSESNEEKVLAENRSMLKKIAVAGACTGNIMLFVIPVYSGLAGSWMQAFNWMSFLLFLPILFYSAQAFYKGAWNSLRYQTVNVDLPITIAMWSGFALSTVNLVRGSGHVYYDSTASFMFLILCARYLLKRVQQNFLSTYRIQDFIQCDHFLRKENGLWSYCSLAEIKVGDVLKVEQRQNCPADGILVSQEALVDLSVLNGESLPRRYNQGLEIHAGSKTLSPYIEIQVTHAPQDTKLASLLRELEENNWNKSDFIALTDRLAQKLIITVFTIAVLFFIFYFNTNPEVAFNRSLALIVLACPCALAFGSPLTLGLALKKAQENGILIKNSNSLEKILKVKNVFFDKTGTLTTADLVLTSSEPEILDEKIKNILISLEQKSYHPVAFAIRKLWSELHPSNVINLQEKLGQGVSGIIHGKNYELKTLSESMHDKALALVLLEDGKVLARLYFEDPLRSDAKQSVQELLSKNLNCYLISGDRRERALECAKECGIPTQNTFAELFPEDKQNIVSKHKNTCMIGDGANDALSLQTADVGIAVKGSMSLSLHAADIYFSRGGLEPLVDLFALAKKAQGVLVRNLTISLVYNTLGGVMALLGFIDPWMAAILMPISSAIIVFSTLWGLR